MYNWIQLQKLAKVIDTVDLPEGELTLSQSSSGVRDEPVEVARTYQPMDQRPTGGSGILSVGHRAQYPSLGTTLALERGAGGGVEAQPVLLDITEGKINRSGSMLGPLVDLEACYAAEIDWRKRKRSLDSFSSRPLSGPELIDHDYYLKLNIQGVSDKVVYKLHRTQHSYGIYQINHEWKSEDAVTLLEEFCQREYTEDLASLRSRILGLIYSNNWDLIMTDSNLIMTACDEVDTILTDQMVLLDEQQPDWVHNLRPSLSERDASAISTSKCYRLRADRRVSGKSPRVLLLFGHHRPYLWQSHQQLISQGCEVLPVCLFNMLRRYDERR